MMKYDPHKLMSVELLEEAKKDGIITVEEYNDLMRRFDYTAAISRELLEEEIRRFDGPGETNIDAIIERQSNRLAKLNEPAIKQIEAQQMRERLAAPPPPPPIRFPMSANRRRNLVFAAIVGSSTLFSLIVRLFLS